MYSIFACMCWLVLVIQQLASYLNVRFSPCVEILACDIFQQFLLDSISLQQRLCIVMFVLCGCNIISGTHHILLLSFFSCSCQFPCINGCIMLSVDFFIMVPFLLSLFRCSVCLSVPALLTLTTLLPHYPHPSYQQFKLNSIVC